MTICDNEGFVTLTFATADGEFTRKVDTFEVSDAVRQISIDCDGKPAAVYWDAVRALFVGLGLPPLSAFALHSATTGITGAVAALQKKLPPTESTTPS